MRAAFIDIDGTRTRYLYEGDAGDTLPLIHGFGLSADIWAHVLDPLAAHFSVYAPDILGHGFTDVKDPGADSAPLEITRHHEGFMDAVGVERYAVLGSSLGGLLAPLIYAARPETIAVPTLFLSGRQDIRAPIEVIEKNYRRVPGAALSVFEECGHLPEVEHPEKFVETVIEFLRR